MLSARINTYHVNFHVTGYATMRHAETIMTNENDPLIPAQSEELEDEAKIVAIPAKAQLASAKLPPSVNLAQSKLNANGKMTQNPKREAKQQRPSYQAAHSVRRTPSSGRRGA